MRDDVSKLISSYDNALAEHGVVPKGILWPNESDLATRFEALLSPWLADPALSNRKLDLLDIGCGPGFLLDYLQENDLADAVNYAGVDVSKKMIDIARSRWPENRFELRDVIADPFPPRSFDVAIACGVFTARFGNSVEEMETFVTEMLRSMWSSVRTGLAFNVMSKHVDWERDDLFHWALDDVMRFCKAELGRHVSFRLDYGLWEMAVFVRREPISRRSSVPASWFS